MVQEAFKRKFSEVKEWFDKHERVLLPATLVFGVVVDGITFANIQIGSTFIILLGHILLSGWVIAYLNAYDAGVVRKSRVSEYIRLLSPYLIQISFGALLSGALIFYVFSGSLFVSWPFITLLVLLMVFNDVFRKYYLQSRIQMGVYFFAVFIIAAVVIPYLLHTLSAWAFVLSGLVSVLYIYGYIQFLSRFIPTISFGIRRFIRPIGIIFVFMNVLYFFNFIPPVPLSVRDSEVVHGSIKKAGDYYTLGTEKENLWERVTPGTTFHKYNDESVTLFTAIFAPGDLRADIYHQWQRFDPEPHKWVDEGRFRYGISGGRKEGFRGYSTKLDPKPGQWRVDVQTSRGQVLGRVRFTVEQVEKQPVLEEKVK